MPDSGWPSPTSKESVGTPPRAVVHPRIRRQWPRLTPSHRMSNEALHSAFNKETIYSSSRGETDRKEKGQGFPASNNGIDRRQSMICVCSGSWEMGSRAVHPEKKFQTRDLALWHRACLASARSEFNPRYCKKEV